MLPTKFDGLKSKSLCLFHGDLDFNPMNLAALHYLWFVCLTTCSEHIFPIILVRVYLFNTYLCLLTFISVKVVFIFFSEAAVSFI